MQRDDYILRMIAQMARVLARVRQLMLEGKHAEAGDELDRVSKQGGVDLRLIIALDEQSLRPLLVTGGEIDRAKCAFFAECVYLEWQRQQSMGNADYAERCADRALLLYALAYEGIVMDSDTSHRVEELKA